MKSLAIRLDYGGSDLLHFLEKQFPNLQHEVEIYKITEKFEYLIKYKGELPREILIQTSIFLDVHKLHATVYIDY